MSRSRHTLAAASFSQCPARTSVPQQSDSAASENWAGGGGRGGAREGPRTAKREREGRGAWGGSQQALEEEQGGFIIQAGGKEGDGGSG